MTTAATVNTSTTSGGTGTYGIGWKVLAGGTTGNIRVKITYQGVSKEYAYTGQSLDPITDPLLWAVVNEFTAHGGANQQLEGNITIAAASTLKRLPADTDWVAGL